MGPKKKQEEVDLSTLGPWSSRNVIVLCSGSKQRANTILNEIKTSSNKMVRYIDQTEVIQHAKTKQLYVDITTLNDKQKKQLKAETPTELTAQVKAKALASLISQLNVAYRIERKAKQDTKDLPPDPKKTAKKQSKKDQKDTQLVLYKQYNKTFDCVYVLQSYPQSNQDFVELQKQGEPIQFVITIRPNLVYPEEQDQVVDENQEQDGGDQNLEGKVQEQKTKPRKYQKETPSEEDSLQDLQILKLIQNIKSAKRQTSPDSEFRNCLISQLKVDINVQSQPQEIKKLPELVFEYLCQLSIERSNYDEWLKNKEKKELATKQVVDSENNPPPTLFETPLQLLLSVAQRVQQVIRDSSQIPQRDKARQLTDIEDLFREEVRVVESKHKLRRQPTLEHFNENYFLKAEKIPTSQDKSLFSYLLLPGIDRIMMPETPEKSFQKRKQQESTFANFLKSGFQDFQRVRTIVELEKLLETIQLGRYNLNNRVYQEYHNRESITDTFNKIFLHDPQIVSKYDQQTDSLLVAILFRNPDSKINYREWTADWKTMPNFDNWFNFFKDNVKNFKNRSFYAVDDLRLGKVGEKVRETTPGDGSVVIQKEQEYCDRKNAGLKVIKDDQAFGVKKIGEKIEFWYTISGHRVSIVRDNTCFQIIITLLNGLIIVVNQQGHVSQKMGNERRKTMTSGFTLLYSDQHPPTILHPNGGFTSPDQFYVNPQGLGVKNPNTLVEAPTLKRTAQAHSIVRRSDETIIIQKDGTKWVKFQDGTVYQITSDRIKIQKQGFAQGQYCDGFTYTYQDVKVIGKDNHGLYSVSINFKDGSQVVCGGQGTFCITGSQKHKQGKYSNFLQQISQNFYKCDYQSSQLIFVGEKDQIGFRIQDVKPDSTLNTNYPVRTDYSQPLLFVLRSDNTAAELLSESQLEDYFRQKQRDPEAEVKKIPLQQAQLIQTISKIYPRPQTTPLQPQYPSNLDVLSLPIPPETGNNYQAMTIRILKKLKPISIGEREQFAETLRRQQEWREDNIKLQNEFGYKQVSRQFLEQEMVFRNKMIERRRQPVEGFPYYSLRDQFIQQLVKRILLQEDQDKTSNRELTLDKKMSSMRHPTEQEKNIVTVREQKLGPQETKLKQYTPYRICKHYFQTPKGQEALSQMPQWVFESPIQILSNMAQNQTNDMLSSKSLLGRNTLKSAPEVPIDVSLMNNTMQSPNYQVGPQDNNISGQATKEIVLKPSVFTQQDIDDQKKAFESEKKAYEYRSLKRKQVNIYGKERTEKPVVPILLRTQPVSQVNQKYILTNSIIDQKVRISSMKNRVSMNSSTLAQLRKQGPHQTLLKTLDLGNTYQQLVQKKTKMIQADISDSLSRDILILPAEAIFGVVKENGFYQLRIEVKNQDVMSQRIAIKRPKTNMVKAFLNQMGPIPLGINRKVIVQLRTTPEMKGKFTDQFQIVSKHQIYKIPVSAQIVSEEAFASMSLKQPRQSLLKLGVTQLKSLDQTLKGTRGLSNTQSLPRIHK